MKLLQHQDYRDYLRGELERRMALKPLYSMRAFARDLGMTPQMLSFVLGKKKSVSPELAIRIADRLELPPADASHLLDLVMLIHAKSLELKKLINHRIQERTKSSESHYRFIDSEVFQVISDWLHTAILELTQTNGFQSDPAWIAKRLGTSSFEVRQALDRLIHLELLHQTASGKITRTGLNLTATYRVPHSGLRKLSRQFLEKAIQSLESQTQDERDLTHITMAIDPKLLPEAKDMITDFRRKLCQFLEQGKRTEVYTFAPSLFRITQLKEKRR